MASFLSKADLQKSITADMLNAVLDGNDALIDQTCDEAVGKMKERLNGKFDVEAIFTATGAERHPVVLAYAKDLTIYMLWKITDPLGIPSLRKDAYKEAMQWLTDCMNGDMSTTLPTTTEPNESGGDFHFGSNDARNNHY
uniref:phage protein Gp36 family protein n=1 Tax=uncultured Draconibacterium sp. TaxID=1573823 RepID=UPI00321676C8